jgi:protein TonB
VLLVSPAPEYPDGARRLRAEGQVLCRLHVDAHGAVTAVDVEESSGHPDLDQAAAQGLKTGRFRPATLVGEPIAALVLHRVRF